MHSNPAFPYFAVGMLVCFGFAVILFIAGGVGLYFLSRSVGSVRHRQVRSLLEDWAEDRDYEVLDVQPAGTRDHPFADRFGFGFGKRPGIVQRIKVRDRRGRVRRGWMYLGAQVTIRGGYSGFLPNTLEVVLDRD
jgi:hypothetical protein